MRARQAQRGPSNRIVIAFVVILFAGGVLLEAASAQRPGATPMHEPFYKSYYVTGRVVDVNGEPLWGANITVSLEHEDVTSYPIRVRSDCHGDFTGVFVTPFMDWSYKVRVDSGGASAEERGNAYTRRSDFVLVRPAARGPYNLPNEATGCYNVSEYWGARYTVTGRAVQYSPGATDEGGATTDILPVTGKRVFAEYWRPVPGSSDHQRFTPPADKPLKTDERGDFKYSWVMENDLSAGFIKVAVEDQEQNISTLDLKSRYSAVFFVLGDAPAPPAVRTPPAPVGLVLVALGAVALALPRNRGPRTES